MPVTGTSAATRPAEPLKVIPPVPLTVEDTGLDPAFLADLTLKAVYADSDCVTDRVADRLRLPTSVTETLLLHLYREKFIEIRGKTRAGHRYGMLDRGWQRAHRLLEVSGYIGPSPVSLRAYTAMSEAQERDRPAVTPDAVQTALGDLILPESTVRTLGLVASSRRSLFITGPPGTGKTTIAKGLHTAVRGEYWIPYAIEVEGQVIKMFDSHSHEPAAVSVREPYDQRWIRIKRPLVIVGGELTIETMDLIYSHTVRFYEASFQMKANGGTLVIDDFGRQRVDPRDLLNRWIIPLESRVDYLTLHTGKKIQVPFEQLLIFATNLDPASLVDEAFLRRMGYRLRMEMVSPETYGQIFRQYADRHGLRHDPSLVDHLLGWYRREARPLVPCEPRDLLELCIDLCRYENRQHIVTPELLELAWTNYFGRPPG